MKNRESLEAALVEQDPVAVLRAIAVEWSRAGLGRKAIHSIFLDLHKQLQERGGTKEEDILGDVMDMIMDTYSPMNLNLPP